MPYYPIVHFLAERPAPHRSSYIVWPFPELPDRDGQIVAAMQAQQTPLVVYNFTQFAVFPVMEEYAPELFDFLVERLRARARLQLRQMGLHARRAAPHAGASGGPRAARRTAQARSPWRSSRRPSRRARSHPASARASSRRSRGPSGRRWRCARRPAANARVATLPLDVPPGARLRTAVGVNPQLWYFAPIGVSFELAVVDGGRREVVYERRLAPTTQLRRPRLVRGGRAARALGGSPRHARAVDRGRCAGGRTPADGRAGPSRGSSATNGDAPR